MRKVDEKEFENKQWRNEMNEYSVIGLLSLRGRRSITTLQCADSTTDSGGT